VNYTVLFLPEIEDDLADIYKWYENKSEGLGEDFLKIFYEKSVVLAQNPLIYQKVFLNFRRVLLKRFPYSVYYLIDKSSVIIYAVFHISRDPKIIKDNLDKR